MDSAAKKYKKLNELADPNGIVLLGGTSDLSIPLGELRQAFSIEQKMYNRSVDNLSVTEAITAYDECVAALTPETLFLHIGEADLSLFSTDPAKFDQCYCELIAHIKETNPSCRFVVVSLRNYENDSQLLEMNKHLKFIADSQKCEYGNIATKKVWNPKNSIETASFVRSLGFVRPLKTKRSTYDLVNMMFCYDL